MTKKHELNPEKSAAIERNLIEHLEILRTLHREAAERAQKYILFTNSGAAIALLGFMGSNSDVRSSPTMWTALIAFVLGIVFCGFVLAIGFHQSELQFVGWIRDTNSFLSGDGDHESTKKNLDARNQKVGWFPVIFAYLAWFAFLFGVGTSLLYMFNRASFGS